MMSTDHELFRLLVFCHDPVVMVYFSFSISVIRIISPKKILFIETLQLAISSLDMTIE